MAAVKQHVVRAVRAVARDLRRPPYVAPGHYYSPRTAGADVERAMRTRRHPAGLDLREAEQLSLAKRLGLQVPPVDRWRPNGMYGEYDAAVLRGMLIDLRPAHLFEIGSGYSTAIALDAADELNSGLRITCVEPFPDRLLSRLKPGDRERLTLVQSPVQDLDPEQIAGQVKAGDVLFIDSTHVVKAGSDVVWLILHTLPLLAKGVVVHVHDIHWPFEYPDSWLGEGRDWTEVYLLHAFLLHNTAWQVLLFTDWLSKEHPEVLPAELRDTSSGSIWIQRVG